MFFTQSKDSLHTLRIGKIAVIDSIFKENISYPIEFEIIDDLIDLKKYEFFEAGNILRLIETHLFIIFNNKTLLQLLISDYCSHNMWKYCNNDTYLSLFNYIISSKYIKFKVEYIFKDEEFEIFFEDENDENHIIRVNFGHNNNIMDIQIYK